MDLRAANRKLPNWLASRLCRRGSVIKSQGIELNLIDSIPERDGHLTLRG